MKHGKIHQFIKNYWHFVLYGIAFLAGVFCGLRACSKSTPVTIDAYRPRISVEQPKTK